MGSSPSPPLTEIIDCRQSKLFSESIELNLSRLFISRDRVDFFISEFFEG